MNQQRVTFPCGDILLEGVWHLPEGTGSFPVVIVCHPHPLYGGDMSNNVVTAICQALSRQSIAAFRFNFRGVGRSGGAYGEGIAEQEDIKAALTFVSSAEGIDANKIGLAGYSFGARVTLPVAVQDERVSQLALVSPALEDSGWEELGKYPRPKFIILGDADEFIPVGWAEQYIEDNPDHKQYQVVAGADHFWWGYEDEVGREVARFFADGFGA